MSNANNKLNLLSKADGPFRPHGRLELWSEGSVLRVQAEGPFNREAVLALGAAIKEFYQILPPDRNFVYLLEFRSSLMASPEALAAFADFLKAMSTAKTAPKAVAFVVAAAVEGACLMLPLFARLYADAGREFSAFETMAAAEDWLRERLRSLAD
ncbi:hypothetical protein [Roseateles oligotrophus]|uniref:STAS/SEC14 domain-containing protein n=1 Tax=Roseateles oligotrophus TaxID=1769250 RepID=A0ABT2YD35_9BURK|nr:hypothetical protein [Roseateles oligotrophus]MCV2367957.1 hypothetical protein [Roseateles oligotrophus]